MPRVALGDLKVHYQQVGRGPDLVLIHGLFCNLAFWYLTVVPKLAENFRVTVYDLRGHGLTARMPAGYRAIDLAEDLRLLLEHLEIGSAHVVGHSFGGAVALAYAIRQPAHVTSLTLADAWIPTLQAWPAAGPQRRSLQASLRQAGMEFEEPLPKVLQEFVEEVVSLESVAADGAHVAVNSLLGGVQKSQALERWNQLVRRTKAAQEFNDGTGIAAEEIRAMRRPTLVMVGNRSRYLPTMWGLRTALSDCRVRLVPDAGHYFPLLNFTTFTQAVSAFASAHDR